MSATSSTPSKNGDTPIKATERLGPPPTARGPMGPAGGTGEKAATFGPSARRLVGRMRPERAATTLVVVITVASVVLTAFGPKLLGHATDLIFDGVRARAAGQGGVDFTAVGHTLSLVLGLYATSALLGWLAGFVLNGVVQRTVRRMRAEVEETLHRLPLAAFDRAPRGELLSRVTNDIDNVSQTLQQTMSQLLTSLVTVVAVLALMISISPLLAMVALVAVPISLVSTRAVMKRSQGEFKAQWRRTGQLNAHIEETFSGHALMKVYGRRGEVEDTFAEHNEGLFRVAFRAQFLSGLIMPTTMFVGNLTYVAVAVVGGLRVASGSLSIGDVQAFIQYSRNFTQPLTTVASMANLLQSGVASAERVFELLDAPHESADADGRLAPEGRTVRGEVVFDDVTFSYDHTDRADEAPLISGLSLRAAPGETVAIVGPTGAGKTTLVNLIMRFYDVDAGAIRIDGTDITEVPRADLRSRIGMVLQDTWLFGGSIRDNIAYGRPTASEEEVLAAARATHVDPFVRSLPDGYDTVVDDDGGNLSAGERQLITIARAFLADPALLILDEATSSVDTRTEVLVQEAMSALRADRTSFVIAHRLSTIRDADTIVVMEHGSIVEQGDHDELLAADGAYARLYRSQFAGAAT